VRYIGAKFGSATTTSWPNPSKHRATHSLSVDASSRIRARGRPPSTSRGHRAERLWVDGDARRGRVPAIAMGDGVPDWGCQPPGMDGTLSRPPEALLESSDQALELGHALTEGGVLGLVPGDLAGGLEGARLPPASDAAPGGADLLGAAARQRRAADHANTGRVRRTYASRRDVRHGAMPRDRRRGTRARAGPRGTPLRGWSREMPSSESCRLSARPRFGTRLADSTRPTMSERSPSRVHVQRGRREGLRSLGLQHDRAARALRPRGSKAPRRMVWRWGELRLTCRRIQWFRLGTGGSPRRPARRLGQLFDGLRPRALGPIASATRLEELEAEDPPSPP
jgi:hypothetical protein